MFKVLLFKLLSPFIALIGFYLLLTMITNYPTQWPLIMAFGFFVVMGLRILIIYIPFRNSMYAYASGHEFWETIRDKGNYGEFLTFNILEKIEGEKGLFVNLYLPKENGETTEIDLVMTHRTGIYVFESKNYSGWIFGNDRQQYWTQTLRGKNKNRFFNPVWQNSGHITALKNVLEIDVKLIESLIVFSERCTLKNVSVNTERVHVMKRNQLKDKLKHVIEGKNYKLSALEVRKLNDQLKQYIHVGADVKESHVRALKAD